MKTLEDDLKGKRFKRDKFGPSIWEDVITDMNYAINLETGKVDIHIKGKGPNWYNINEIWLIDYKIGTNKELIEWIENKQKFKKK